MTITEFDDDICDELNRKFANVSLEPQPVEDILKEILFGDLYEYRDTLRSSSNQRDLYFAMKNIRRFLTEEISTERIQIILELDILDIMTLFLTNPSIDNLRYETAWAVTNLAFGTKEQTSYLIQHGVVHALIQCFRTTESSRVKSQTAWGLANISIDSAIYREEIVKLGVIGDIGSTILQKCSTLIGGDDDEIVFRNKTDRDDMKELTWSLANVCRGGFKTAEYWEQYLTAFQALSQCTFFNADSVWSEACWGLSRILSNMFDNELFYFHLNLNPKLYTRLVTLIRDQTSDMVLPVLQTISNFTSAPNNYIEGLLAVDLVSSLQIYTVPGVSPPLRRNALLTIANLAAGGEELVSKVIYNENIMKNVMLSIKIPCHELHSQSWIKTTRLSRTKQKEEWKILKESLWVLSNIFALANEEGICFILRKYPEVIQCLSSLLYFPLLPLTICLKLVDVFQSIVERTNQITVTAGSPHNPYLEDIVGEGVPARLNEQCISHGSDELRMQSELLYNSLTAASTSSFTANPSAFQLASTLHLPGPSVRRIVHGFEDGDIRFIENAFTNIQLQ